MNGESNVLGVWHWAQPSAAFSAYPHDSSDFEHVVVQPEDLVRLRVQTRMIRCRPTPHRRSWPGLRTTCAGPLINTGLVATGSP